MSDNEEGWEEDDMADLFSFGNDGGASPKGAGANGSPAATHQDTAAPAVVKDDTQETRERTTSNDSLLEMLDGETGTETLVLGESSTSKPTMPMKDQDAQDILNWLDEDDASPAAAPPEGKVVVEKETAACDEKEKVQVEEKSTEEQQTNEKDEQAAPPPAKPAVDKAESSTPAPPEPAPTIVALPPPKPTPPIHFDSLDDALDSSQSTIQDLRALFVDGGMKVAPERRAALWCRTVCGKTLDDVESSSLAESFLDWKQMANIEEGDDARSVYIRNEADILAERVVAGSAQMTLEEAKRALCEVLLFYYQSSSGDSQEVDPLLPPVACAILSAGVPVAATTVVLTSIMPSFMPLLALSQTDRWEAAKSLHTQFYLLACYHLPLLVFHLDRYAPGWYWPKKLNDDKQKEGDVSVTEKGRNLESQGVVPQSWLISHLAGECGGTLMNPMWLLSLWDLILTSSNNSLRFFLSLAILEKYSDTLLMLTGDDLLYELQRIMEFKEGTTPEGFAIVAEEETSETEAGDFVADWCERARSLWEATPRSVVSQLRTAEDEAVKTALLQRQKKSEEELKARLEEEARAHREAAEAEKERKAEEARLRLSRARLVAYYRTHNPEKEGNIDKIMEVYKGRLDVLDMKLKSKYGVSFKPALKPKPAKTTQKLSTIMNQGLSARRNAEKPIEEPEPQLGDPGHQVAVKVLATEVLPVICWSKEAASSKSVTALARGRYSEEQQVPLKFYLIDSRPESTAAEQGSFPTAIVVSPEALLDPDRIQQHEEMFESLRGAVHICVMGEGFSAVPHLYNQKVTPKLQHYIDEDESRTSLCALFFVKKGFPFVSILDGGFVQAHAWLCREGPKRHLDAASVLVDYDEDNSFFGRLEKSYRTQQELANATVGEKTQHILQSFLDSSMTTLARTARRVEEAAAEIENEYSSAKVKSAILATPEENAEEESFVGSPIADGSAEGEETEAAEEPEGNFVSRFAGKLNKKAEKDTGGSKENADSDKKDEPAEEAEPKFKNPFGGFRKTDADGEAKDSEADTPVFRNPFAARRSVVPDKGDAEDKTEEKAPAKEEEDVEDPDMVDVTIASTTEPNKPGTFSRLARAASSSIQKVGGEQQGGAAQNPLKRNPFARFGGANKPAEKKVETGETKKPVNRFGGISMNNMNQLRKNTLSSLRAKAAGDNADRAGKEEHDLVEESISFNHDDTVTPSGGSTPGDEEKPKEEEPTEDAVVESV